MLAALALKPGDLYVDATLGAGGYLRAARDAFYKGDVAAAIVRFHRKNGGLMRMEDFADYSIKFEPTVKARFNGIDVHACGPWSQGPVLPMALLIFINVATIGRVMRGSLIEVLHSNFIRTARAQGLSTGTILLRHALKPALIPVVSYLGPATAGLITGSVVIETIFDLPGLGRYLVQGALNRDYTLVLGTVILYAVLIMALNLVVDTDRCGRVTAAVPVGATEVAGSGGGAAGAAAGAGAGRAAGRAC